KPRPAPRATPPSTRPPRRMALSRSCSATPSTTRRRPFCSSWPAGPGGRSRAVVRGRAGGSGGGSLAGMPARRGRYLRPLLAVRRASTAAACADLDLKPWQDPPNEDFRLARARVRHRALPALEEALGPGVAEALARTAAQLRADTECLDDLAFAEGGQLRATASDPAGLDASWLVALPQAIRARVLRDAAIMAGCPHGALTAGHV